ncbi:hypothetical protein AMAG_06186 [Allomyces macrogynus ATCC 38327]|uniref:N-terminal methionine N(alpha)-acetyltransferase NatE n=1 Tax=Allomyces macrogynus (strain ATCC 38327) TaxID=578462 RepID=A0A0L0SFY1_ALLM3|nr:hypothetical protein AMAG_06186 [Allomyces macrogynus ATCC 38327]|eukprot:KNE61357.1 hypothetical protein AMAG_06186 [Allomyces macrogynus ATCC 38327]
MESTLSSTTRSFDRLHHDAQARQQAQELADRLCAKATVSAPTAPASVPTADHAAPSWHPEVLRHDQGWSAKVDLRDITHENVESLRVLNAVIFPVRYNDKFYTDVAEMGGQYVKAAYHRGHMIGAVCCRREPAENGLTYSLYVMTLGVMSVYRRLGIGSLLIEYVLRNARMDPACTGIRLHVQTSNEEAQRFYHRLGFDTITVVRNYYFRLTPPDAFLLELTFPRDPVGVPDTEPGS